VAIFSGKARLAGVMGWPVAHSLSPRLHGYWLDHYGIDGVYVPLAVHPSNLQQAIEALPGLGFCGLNVTVPHKETVMQYLDHVDEKARRSGAWQHQQLGITMDRGTARIRIPSGVSKIFCIVCRTGIISKIFCLV